MPLTLHRLAAEGIVVSQPCRWAKYGRAFHQMIQKKLEFPEKPQPEHIVLLIELIAAFQKIPQRYCLLCKAKSRLGIEAHKPSCPLRRAFNLVKAAQQKIEKPL